MDESAAETNPILREDQGCPDYSSTAAWEPSQDVIRHANVTNACEDLGFANYDELYRWSVAEPQGYWAYVMDRLWIRVSKSPQALLSVHSPTQALWLGEAQMNIVDSCFQGQADSPAIRYTDGAGPVQDITVDQLKNLVERAASCLTTYGVKSGDKVALVLPMTPIAVAIFLAIVSIGAAVVSIPESLAAQEIARRFELTGPVLTITQDKVSRGGKLIDLYERVCTANSPPAFVLHYNDPAARILRDEDGDWWTFIRPEGTLSPREMSAQDPLCILFSSGTTSDPKGIVWDHTTPIKCAADGHFHQDIHEGDVVCWPTSLGWMMGPWLVFASLINRATIALYDDTPLHSEFGRFVSDAGVTMLGTVPSIVRHWRTTGCMEGHDWSRIRVFSSTGECSNSTDVRYLMDLGGNKPVIEYCGGTEIGGGYITGVVVKPCIPSMFNTPALGIEFEILDESGLRQNSGEVFIVSRSIGLSTRLINQDHDAVYFAGAGTSASGVPRRRHGDELAALPGGYYQMLGRCDDTMNLGGIKVGCVQIERVVERVEGIVETAAVAVSEDAGGPSRLVVCAVVSPDCILTPDELCRAMQHQIRDSLSPLFHIGEVRIVEALPRTASNKIIRRRLRSQLAC